MRPELLCEVCWETNVWFLFDPRYEYVCKPCVEVGDDVGFDEESGHYRRVERCPGCGATGLVNFGRDDRQVYYCGGSPSCCP